MTTLEKKVIDYIRANYDIPKRMSFWHGYREYEFEDWVERYVDQWEENHAVQNNDDDAEVIGEELLEIMTGHLLNGCMTDVFTVHIPTPFDKNNPKFRDVCGGLYDGGWRKEDRWLLIDTYTLDPQEADAICEVLAEIEGIENEEQ